MELNWRVRDEFRMDITPPISLRWLEHHNHHNRSMSAARVEQYARDMASGRFLETGESISFDWNGENINGQHRLQAIHESQVTLKNALIVTGVDPAARPVVDIHGKRSAYDAFHFSGMGELLGGQGSVARNTAAGMWARIRHGIVNRKGNETRQELIDFARRYADGGRFSLDQFGSHPAKRSVCVAPVMAAVARAFYHYKTEQDRFRLSRFVEALATGIQKDPGDRTVIVLRESLQNIQSRNSNAQADIYGKTCRTIQAYMRGDYLAKIYRPTQEPFPLPDLPTPNPSATPRLAGMAGRRERSEHGIQAGDLVAASSHSRE